MILYSDRTEIRYPLTHYVGHRAIRIASAIFLPILIRQHRRVQPLTARDIPTFLLLGQLGISLLLAPVHGVQLTNAGISAVIVVG